MSLISKKYLFSANNAKLPWWKNCAIEWWHLVQIFINLIYKSWFIFLRLFYHFLPLLDVCQVNTTCLLHVKLLFKKGTATYFCSQALSYTMSEVIQTGVQFSSCVMFYLQQLTMYCRNWSGISLCQYPFFLYCDC